MKYALWPTGEIIEIEDLKNYRIIMSGSTVLVKLRPPVAKEVSTD